MQYVRICSRGARRTVALLLLGLCAARAAAAPPVANPDTARTDFGTAVTIRVLQNDSDPDGDALTLAAFPQKPANGRVAKSGRAARYTPKPGFHGTDTFTYRVTDATGRSRSASVTVTVRPPPNRAPVAAADAAAAADGAAVTIAVLGNDSDPDGDTLRLRSTTAPANGTAAISGTAVRYTPAPGFSGTDTFDYTAGDGRGGTATATVTVEVTAAEPQGSATLSWGVPTTRANGSPITVAEISGYEIYMVAESTGVEQVIEVAGGATTTHTVTGLAPDTYHFSMAAMDTQGSLSELSEVVSKTIAP